MTQSTTCTCPPPPPQTAAPLDHSGGILCNPNCMCFSFRQNNRNRLEGNSAQSTDKESSGIQRQGEERCFQALKHPWWDYTDNVLGSLLSPCLDPSASPPHNSTLQYQWLVTNNYTLDSVWFSNSPALYGNVLRLVGMGLCSTPDASFLLSRLMTGQDEHISPPHSQSIGMLNIPPQSFPRFVFMKICQRRCIWFFLQWLQCDSRCLHHTFQQWAPVPTLIQVRLCLHMRGNEAARAASCQDQVLPVWRSGQDSVWLI